MSELVTWLRARLNGAACAVTGHRPIRTITGLRLDEVTAFGARGTITSDRVDCRRCARRLGARSGDRDVTV